MPLSTFDEWLQNRIDDAPPDATTVALTISRAGAEGVTLSGLRRKTRLPSDVLHEFLKGLSASGQVVLSKVNGRLVYRAAG